MTANPALGVASDLLVAQGGTSILGETPEIYGAEHLLTRRAVSRAVGEKLVERIKWWEWYTGIFGAEINNNPSPGNKESGDYAGFALGHYVKNREVKLSKEYIDDLVKAGALKCWLYQSAKANSSCYRFSSSTSRQSWTGNYFR